MEIKKSTLQNIFKGIGGLVLLLVIAFILFGKSSKDDANTKVISNDSSDTQIIEITAKGGYSPKLIEAKANKKSILKITTNKTFDCSSALIIPKLKVDRFLPDTGVTEFEIEPQKAGSEINGSCSMGMYGFKIKFK